MCIAIYKPAGCEVSYDEMAISAKNNPDGCGLAFINGDGELEIQKHMDFEAFYLIYQECYEENPDSPFFLHFRIMTHGKINEFNCHPFQIDDDHVMMHNGTIHPVPKDKTDQKSDTQMFNELILQGLPEGWMDNEPIQWLIEEYIGFSKVLVMNSEGDVQIYNEDKGHWKDGVWYSNESYKEKKKKYYAATDTGSEWWVDGKRRRWGKEGIEQYDYKKGKWRLFDWQSQTYLDETNVIQLPERTALELIECEWCTYASTDGLDFEVMQVEGYTSICCNECVQEWREYGLTNILRTTETVDECLEKRKKANG